MLSELQEEIARILLSTVPDPELALAGGAALISTGLVDRQTIDLDLFTTSSEVNRMLEPTRAELIDAGFDVETLIETPTFVRIVVARGGERCQVDLAQDARLLPAVTGPLGRTLASEELVADKVLALFSRAIARDYVDVFFLARRFGKERLLGLAKQKDRGFDAALFAQMLAAIERLDRDEFTVDDATLEHLRAFFAAWRDELTK